MSGKVPTIGTHIAVRVVLLHNCITGQKHLLLARYIKKLSRVKLSDLLGSEEWPAWKVQGGRHPLFVFALPHLPEASWQYCWTREIGQGSIDLSNLRGRSRVSAHHGTGCWLTLAGSSGHPGIHTWALPRPFVCTTWLSERINTFCMSFTGSTKVSMPNLVIYLYWTPIFELCMVTCASKNRCQKDMSINEIGWHFSKSLHHSRLKIQNNWGDLHDRLKKKDNLYFDNEQDIHEL